MKLTYNAPLVLTFCLVATGLFIINDYTDRSLDSVLVLHANFSFSSITDWLSIIGQTFGHANWQHLLGNFTFLLLLGPVLEEKYGTGQLALMAVTTAVVTSIIQLIFFNYNSLGASGLVFMCIILVSFVNVKAKEIPLTFVLVFALFVGQEIYNSFNDDNISQYAHIMGGICGGIFGFALMKGKPNAGGGSVAAGGSPMGMAPLDAPEPIDFSELNDDSSDLYTSGDKYGDPPSAQ
jgi:membrane associated rhomboid family serine protease